MANYLKYYIANIFLKLSQLHYNFHTVKIDCVYSPMDLNNHNELCNQNQDTEYFTARFIVNPLPDRVSFLMSFLKELHNVAF